MFNLIINWLKIVKENIPLDLHNNWLFDWLKVLISPINKIYTEFLQAYDVFILKIRYNGQIIYLEKILNAKFSPISGGIYIVDAAISNKYYLYNKIELKPPHYIYVKWQSGVSFPVDSFCVYKNKVYKSLVTNTGFAPDLNPLKWLYVKEVEFLRNKAEFYLTYNFIVRVPSAIVFNEISMRGIIDYYRLAGKRYKIEIY